MQNRLPKFQRAPERISHMHATERSLIIISTVLRYRFLPASLAVRVVAGDERTTQKHLQFLFHRGLLNRFAFPKARGHFGEFTYYLDSQAAIDLLQEASLLPDDADLASVRNNREKNYAGIYEGDEVGRLGRLMFLRHELAISRWHAMLELGARASNGKVKLVSWSQGAALYNTVTLPRPEGRADLFGGRSEIQKLPHRPDAFFSLAVEGHPEPKFFFYEADRKTSNATRFKQKLRAYFHFIVKQRKHEKAYGVKRIRAVVVETLDRNWAEHLRREAADPIVSGAPSPLFWITPSDLLTKPIEVSGKSVPLFLHSPGVIFEKRFATPVDDNLYSLLD